MPIDKLATEKKVKWACPRCGALPDKHGKGGATKCRNQNTFDDGCQGFLCDCEDEAADHGDTYETCCHAATCHHCDWVGVFPPPPLDLKKLPPWAKTAWEAGWRPPVGWAAKRTG